MVPPGAAVKASLPPPPWGSSKAITPLLVMCRCHVPAGSAWSAGSRRNDCVRRMSAGVTLRANVPTSSGGTAPSLIEDSTPRVGVADLVLAPEPHEAQIRARAPAATAGRRVEAFKEDSVRRIVEIKVSDGGCSSLADRLRQPRQSLATGV